MEINNNLALQMQVNTLAHELTRAKQKTSISVGFSAVAVVVSGILWFSHSNPPPISAPAPPTLPENVTFQSVVAQSVQIVGPDGKPAALLNSNGLYFKGPLQNIEFDDANGKELSSLDGLGLNMYGVNGGQTSVSPGEVILRPASSFNSGITSIYPGTITIDTPQNYTVDIGAFGYGPAAVGIDITNDHYDKTHAGTAAVDQTTTAVMPDDIELSDSSGIERASIGETQLTTPTTGATSTTALSSITLFDKSSRLIWQTPQ